MSPRRAVAAGAGTVAAPRQARRRRRAPAAPARRYRVVYDVDGPRVRLGVGWFVLALGAVLVAPVTTAAVYGGAAGLGAGQAAKAWRRVGGRASVPLAAAAAGAASLGALLGEGGLGLGILVGVALALIGAAGERGPRAALLGHAGLTVQCGLVLGLVAGSMVLVRREDVGAALALLLLASAYEVGDYLVGSGSSNAFEGPIAGIAAGVVVGFVVSAFPVTSLEVGEAAVLSAVAVLGAPVGQLVASAVLPDARASAPGLRRLDSLILAAPVWAWVVANLG
ncbi:MAG: hypothetical protein AB7L84_01280 [Acidimicrobiia bacterium]